MSGFWIACPVIGLSVMRTNAVARRAQLKNPRRNVRRWVDLSMVL